MTLVEQITADLTAAMKAQDAPRTSVLRMAKAALKNKEIDKKAPLDDAEAAKVLQGLVKQREDSIEQFAEGEPAGAGGQGRGRDRGPAAYLPAGGRGRRHRRGGGEGRGRDRAPPRPRTWARS